jgi:hypothetical protein
VDLKTWRPLHEGRRVIRLPAAVERSRWLQLILLLGTGGCEQHPQDALGGYPTINTMSRRTD